MRPLTTDKISGPRWAFERTGPHVRMLKRMRRVSDLP
jgi:hypothetical protein